MVTLGTSYCFDDVLMEPLYSNIQSRSQISLETNIATNNRTLILKTPLISSPMDTVTETQMAIKMALAGGLGIIHRFMTIEDQVAQVVKVKRFLQYIIKEPYRVLPTATYLDVEELIEKYGVSTYCVVKDLESNEFLGILTRRDIEAMKNYSSNVSDSAIQVSDFMTAYVEDIDCCCNTKCKCNCNGNIIGNGTGSIHVNHNSGGNQSVLYTNNYKIVENNPDSILRIAKDAMLYNRCEKIPILESNSRLAGLITLKNIRHWENNKTKACIDSTGALCVGAAIGIVGDYMERLEELAKANVDLICVDVANGFNEHVVTAIRSIRLRYPTLVLMAGNVCNAAGFQFLSDPTLDIDCIRVGIGNGSICTTRLETGIGKGQFSAIQECFQAKRDQGLKPHIICDGGSLGKTGNKVKALAAGAVAVMLGRTLASTEESPGQIIYRNGRRFKYIRGMASTMANLSKQEKSQTQVKASAQTQAPNKKLKTDFTSEGVDGEQELTGSVLELIEQINGGIRSGLSYLGSINLVELHEKAKMDQIKFNLVTSIGMSETGIRVKTY
jgi:IMP dehydrogenase